jgi:hypothetical protein
VSDKDYLELALAPLVSDVRQRLRPDFDVDLYEEDGLWFWRSSHEAGSFPSDFANMDLAALIVFCAERIPISESEWKDYPWPPCPNHPDHGLQPRTVEGRAMWVCPTGQVQIAIGKLET